MVLVQVLPRSLRTLRMNEPSCGALAVQLHAGDLGRWPGDRIKRDFSLKTSYSKSFIGKVEGTHT